jgi:hypothetical protein
MSAETMEWLNQYTLQTDREWHYREEFQKDGGNVFERTVPLEAIERLMGWKAVEGSAPKTTLLLPDGVVEAPSSITRGRATRSMTTWSGLSGT